MRLEDNDLLKHVPLEKPSRPSSCTTKNLDEVDQDFELFYFQKKVGEMGIQSKSLCFFGIWNCCNRFQSGFEDAL